MLKNHQFSCGELLKFDNSHGDFWLWSEPTTNCSAKMCDIMGFAIYVKSSYNETTNRWFHLFVTPVGAGWISAEMVEWLFALAL